MTNLYLAVIIRDYLRFFIKNTPAIGNTAWEDISRMHKATPEENNAASVKWEAMVNSVAEEFDEGETVGKLKFTSTYRSSRRW